MESGGEGKGESGGVKRPALRARWVGMEGTERDTEVRGGKHTKEWGGTALKGPASVGMEGAERGTQERDGMAKRRAYEWERGTRGPATRARALERWLGR
jgi:hypothetical protein